MMSTPCVHTSPFQGPWRSNVVKVTYFRRIYTYESMFLAGSSLFPTQRGDRCQVAQLQVIS